MKVALNPAELRLIVDAIADKPSALAVELFGYRYDAVDGLPKS